MCCAPPRATLPEAFENEASISGSATWPALKEPRPRPAAAWPRWTAQLGDLLGQKYVELAFGADAKAQITQLVERLEKAMGEDIETLPWMTDETKKAALAKLKAITNNVGYPKKWRDYGKVTIARDDYLRQRRAHCPVGVRPAHREDRQADGQVRMEHDARPRSTPSTARRTTASISRPASCKLPFFDPRRDMAVNYGGVGAVIGHEMTHGFDDQGRKFDGDGNLRDWWTAADGAEFEKRAACVANEYSSFTAVDDVKLNGRLTLGENTADNGGLRVA